MLPGLLIVLKQIGNETRNHSFNAVSALIYLTKTHLNSFFNISVFLLINCAREVVKNYFTKSITEGIFY